jgi:hypothetical protein
MEPECNNKSTEVSIIAGHGLHNTLQVDKLFTFGYYDLYRPHRNGCCRQRAGQEAAERERGSSVSLEGKTTSGASSGRQ